MWTSLHSVSVKFLLILVPSVMLAAAAFSGALAYAKYQQLHHALVERVDAVGRTGVQSLAEPLWSLNEDSVRSILDGFSVHAEIACVEVVDDLTRATFSRPEKGCFDRKGPARHIEVPIVYAGKPIGQLRMRVGTEHVWATLSQEVAKEAGLL
ncbi:MAG: hypothetical protein K2Q10_12545, partial [Rhodospirillales bacterium]|nr:hypothetical protein [Rhodospirillales bacterium]